jgi:hypothetical protein
MVPQEKESPTGGIHGASTVRAETKNADTQEGPKNIKTTRVESRDFAAEKLSLEISKKPRCIVHTNDFNIKKTPLGDPALATEVVQKMVSTLFPPPDRSVSNKKLQDGLDNYFGGGSFLRSMPHPSGEGGEGVEAENSQDTADSKDGILGGAKGDELDALLYQLAVHDKKKEEPEENVDKVDEVDGLKGKDLIPDWFPVLNARGTMHLSGDDDETRLLVLMNRIAYLYQQVEGDAQGQGPKKKWDMHFHEPSLRWEYEHQREKGGWWMCRSGDEAPQAERECNKCHRTLKAAATSSEPEDYPEFDSHAEHYNWIMSEIKEAMREVADQDKQAILARLGTGNAKATSD